MPAFKIRWFKNEPISETVGNGLCAVPETSRIEPVRLNGFTPVGAAISRPPRCEYNLCGQNGTTSRHVIPSERK